MQMGVLAGIKQRARQRREGSEKLLTRLCLAATLSSLPSFIKSSLFTTRSQLLPTQTCTANPSSRSLPSAPSTPALSSMSDRPAALLPLQLRLLRAPSHRSTAAPGRATAAHPRSSRAPGRCAGGRARTTARSDGTSGPASAPMKPAGLIWRYQCCRLDRCSC